MDRPMILGTVFDVLLVVALLGMAVKALVSANLVTAVAAFIAFGFLMTLAWIRLGAPDVALAEAGIGTGFTGALLLSAVARLADAAAAGRPTTQARDEVPAQSRGDDQDDGGAG